MDLFSRITKLKVTDLTRDVVSSDNGGTPHPRGKLLGDIVVDFVSSIRAMQSQYLIQDLPQFLEFVGDEGKIIGTFAAVIL